MVLQKRLDYGFNGYHVPYTPRATRSARVMSLSYVYSVCYLHYCFVFIGIFR